jgi:hypothetical protein
MHTYNQGIILFRADTYYILLKLNHQIFIKQKMDLFILRNLHLWENKNNKFNMKLTNKYVKSDPIGPVIELLGLDIK